MSMLGKRLDTLEERKAFLDSRRQFEGWTIFQQSVLTRVAHHLCSAKTTVVRKMHQCRCRFKEFYALREEDLFSHTALCEAELQWFDFKGLGSVTSTPFLVSSGNCCKMDFSS